ncbi:hypothetical protein [Halorubrum aquaticum]|uniref:hypothetical protein n=1 Tax=Halorubrum aquaticum TaxID=387340 RepID=UPI00165F8195|nr:hypothetical protein [Halorubrum aquaticum]
MSPIVLVAVNATEVRREVRTATQAIAGFNGRYPEIHHVDTTRRFVRVIDRREGVAIGDVWNPISGAGSSRTGSVEIRE